MPPEYTGDDSWDAPVYQDAVDALEMSQDAIVEALFAYGRLPKTATVTDVAPTQHSLGYGAALSVSWEEPGLKGAWWTVDVIYIRESISFFAVPTARFYPGWGTRHVSSLVSLQPVDGGDVDFWKQQLARASTPLSLIDYTRKRS